MRDIELSIIIAVYSETQTVPETIERLFKKDSGYIKEIILMVSPQSSKACLDICQKAAIESKQVKLIIQKHNPGVGWAFRDGIDMACGTHLALMAGDLETEPEAVDRMVSKAAETGCDTVAASRWHKEGGFEGYGRLKMCVNYLFQRLFMFLFWTPITDLTLGFKLYKTNVIKNVLLESTGAQLVLESILKIIKSGGSVQEVPTKWVRRSEGVSKNKSALNTLVKHLKIGFKVYLAPTSTLRRI